VSSPRALTAQQIMVTIMARAERQLATTREAKAIVAAGLERELRSLIEAIAGNSAQVIEGQIEDALTPAL
jgi:type IV secretory pathway VirB2 component (pilin)